jgi:hypothetical protein
MIVKGGSTKTGAAVLSNDLLKADGNKVHTFPKLLANIRFGTISCSLLTCVFAYIWNFLTVPKIVQFSD